LLPGRKAMVDDGVQSGLARTSGWMAFVDSVQEKVSSSFCNLYIQGFLLCRRIDSLIDG
jgi:hypothetical protein